MRASMRDPYPVYIGSGLLPVFDFAALKASSFVIVTDTTVDELLANQLIRNPSLRRFESYKIVLPVGEHTKTLTQAEKVLSFLAQNNLDRETVLLALGGGVIGDLTGFVASIYKRGVRHVHIPTTLLAQVDSSLGGKTAVNIPEGKNLIGSMHNPLAIITDLSLLSKLPKSELANGYCELVKYAMIWDKKLFSYIEKHLDTPSEKVYIHYVKIAAKIKLAITREDPTEKEFRKILNYGHTVGHALETLSDHKISHGQAVGLGMVAEGFIAKSLGRLPSKAFDRQNKLIRRIGVAKVDNLDVEKLLEIMRRDKKSKSGKLYFVMPKRIGKIYKKKKQVSFRVDEKTVRSSIEFLLAFSQQRK